MELRLDVTRIAPGALKTLDYTSRPNISVRAVKFHLEATKEVDLFVEMDKWIWFQPRSLDGSRTALCQSP